MVSVTLSLPEDVKKKMDHFQEMNWSGFIRKTILEKTKELSWKEDMLSKLEEEKETDAWTVQLQRSGRKERTTQLKKKGFL